MGTMEGSPPVWQKGSPVCGSDWLLSTCDPSNLPAENQGVPRQNDRLTERGELETCQSSKLTDIQVCLFAYWCKLGLFVTD